MYNICECDRMDKYLRMMQKYEMPQLVLEDKQMPHTCISKEKNSVKYTSSGPEGYISAARTSQPLLCNMAAVYFEADVIKVSSNSEVAVGIIHKDCALKRHPGDLKKSIGYSSTGEIHINGLKVIKTKPYGTAARVGMGIVYSMNKLCVTLNGRLLEQVEIPKDSQWVKYFPCVSLKTLGDEIGLVFKDFKFDFGKFMEEAHRECAKQIEKEDISELDTYKLLADYLQFYGYSETLSLLRDKYDVGLISCFVEHPFLNRKLYLPDTNSHNGNQEKHDPQPNQACSQDGIHCTPEANNHNPPEGKDADNDQQLESQIFRRSSARHRIMSDYWGDMVPGEATRKRTIGYEKQLLESRRKSSVISNDLQNKLSQPDNATQAMQQTIYDEPTTNFLLKARIDILKLIRSLRIEQAYNQLRQSLPELFEIYEYLHSYFHMQNYMKILKLEGSSRAMAYVKKQNEHFKTYRKGEFLVFNVQKKNLEFKEFSFMMGLVSHRNLQKCPCLSDEQFEGFACYVNQLILQAFGLYFESRLDLLVGHIKTIGLKNQQHQITGPLFLSDF